MLKNGFTLLLVLLSFQDFSSAWRYKRGVPFVEKCPTTWHHPKCTCETSDLTNLATIQCKNIQDPSEIQTAFTQDWSDNSKSFDWFTLEDSTLTSIPDAIFGNYSFLGFIVSNSTISDISDNAFQGMGSSVTCQYVWITRSNLAGFNFKSLQVMKRLYSVALTESRITEVPDEAFGRLEALDTINLENNAIDQIGVNAFASLPKLRVLNLSGNKLGELKNGQLKLTLTRKPVSIDLSKNNIASIESRAFTDLAQPPSDLNLVGNKLTSLSEKTFAPLLTRMRDLPSARIRIYGNPLVCDASMDWLLQSNYSKYNKIVQGLQCSDGRRPLDNKTP